MILVASERSSARALAAHLMKTDENDHVTVLELRGFMANTLAGSLDEINAIAKGTHCKKFLFSLSINPPADGNASLEMLIDAANQAEDALDLIGQPRAIVAHEKNGRRHIHVVWSRIDALEMKAINLPFFKRRMGDLSRDLYLEYGWDLPDGHKLNGWKSPLNFTLAEWQQAKRLDLDPREIKQVFQEAWAASDNLTSFQYALEEHGYFLAKGDRRGFVALDVHGEVYSVPRWAGQKARDVATRLGSPDVLPTVNERWANIDQAMKNRLLGHLKADRKAKKDALEPEINQARKLAQAHRAERARFKQQQAERQEAEIKVRARKFKRGLGAVLDYLTGRTATTRQENEADAFRCHVRDSRQREQLYEQQMQERQLVQKRIDTIKARQREECRILQRRLAERRRAAQRPGGYAPRDDREKTLRL